MFILHTLSLSFFVMGEMCQSAVRKFICTHALCTDDAFSCTMEPIESIFRPCSNLMRVINCCSVVPCAGERTELQMGELRKITNVGTKTPVYILCLTELKRLKHVGGASNTSLYKLCTNNWRFLDILHDWKLKSSLILTKTCLYIHL